MRPRRSLPLLVPAAPAPCAVPLRGVALATGAARTAAELWLGVHLPGGAAGAQLAALAERAQRFTPRVSLEPPDGLLLEVRGSLHLFAGIGALRAALLGECRGLQLQAQLACAPTPFAALCGARAGRSFEILEPAQLIGQLTPLPLTVLRWPEDTVARLGRLGVRTVGAALRLPRAGFARRFGPAALATLDRLTGRAPEVRAAFAPGVRFRRRRELDCELTSHARLLAALTPLCAELGAFLDARQCGVTEFECRLVHRQHPATCCLVRLAAPSADAQRFIALLGEHLAALPLPEAVRACELRAARVVAQPPQAACLWQPGEHGGSLAREACGLIERLRARLGPEAIHGLTFLEGHRPEHAWSLGPPPATLGAQARSHAAAAAPPTPRPLWLLAPPQPLAASQGWPRRRGPLRLVSEPERIESGWWDGAEIARDYYTAVDAHGVRLWVFRERRAPHGWFLHGVFG